MAERTSRTNKQAPAPRKKPQRLNLPFSKRKRDVGTWVYDHRAGLCAMLILYMVIVISFIGSKIIVRMPKQDNRIMVDLRTLEELQREEARLEREVRMRQQSADSDNAYMRNLVSNEGAELRDDRNTDVSAIKDRADNVDSRERSNRDAWDQGMREIEAMKGDKGDKTENANNDSRVKGRVMVSFSLVSPVRYSADLVIPGYRCERGGEIVVQVIVNRSGAVVSASVERSLSDNDNCMHATALDAARRSTFNVDNSAPERQTGTITYIFIPQ